jgi:type II secretory pathway component PulF
MITSILKSLAMLLTGMGPVLLGSTFARGDDETPFGGPEPEYPEIGEVWRSIAFWLLVSLFIILVVAGIICGVVPGLIVLIVGFLAFHRWWTARQHALLWTMAVAAERLIPLGPAIRAFAAERSGVLAYRAMQLADMLEAGVPLPIALDSIPSLLPAEARAKIRVGHETGALAPAIRDAIEVRESHESFWNAAVGRLLYVLAVLLFACCVLTFILLKLAPQFRKIFDEFGLELPAMTQWVIESSYYATVYWWAVIAPAGLILLVIYIYAKLRYVGVLGPGAPVIGWFERRLVTASILENLALVAGRDRPMAEGVGTLAATYPSRTMRVRLGRVLRDIQSGRDWCESLAARRLIRKTELAVLQAAQRVGNLPWALKEMADSNRRRQAYRAQIWLQFLFPVAVLSLGLLVGTVVIAFFVPLIKLVQALT